MLNIADAPFNCRGDGISDSTDGFDRALAAIEAASERRLFAPAGHYRLKGGHAFTTLGMSLVGEGVNATRFTITDPMRDGFTLRHNGAVWPPVLADISLSDFTLERENGGNDDVVGLGINCASPVYRSRYERLLIMGHRHGMQLGETDYSIVRDVIVQESRSHGVLVANTQGGGDCQYSFEHCLFQANGGSGLHVQAKPGPARVSLGELINVSTWGNREWGVNFSGLHDTPICGVRVLGGFLGEDGAGGMRLETHGGYHKIVGLSIELSGRLPADLRRAGEAGDGPGLTLSEFEQDVLVQGVRINGSRSCGLITGGAMVNISGCSISNSGLDNSVRADRAAIRVVGGRAHIVGNTLFNRTHGDDGTLGVQVWRGCATPRQIEEHNLTAGGPALEAQAPGIGPSARRRRPQFKSGLPAKLLAPTF